MKVYISVDMEGASGICTAQQCSKDGQFYSQGRRLLLSDVNAAVEGAFAGGATEVIVADMHNGSFNLNHEEMHPKAQVIYGIPHGGPRFPLLDETVDAMFLIAYHAKAGTPFAVLEHTMSSKEWYRVVVNGKEIGETGIDAALAGCVGVPVVMVSGDDKLCAEARNLLGPIETVEVKKGLARQRGCCLPIEKTRQMLFESAKRALSLKDTIKPFSFGSPVEIDLTYKYTHCADGAPLNNPAVIRKDGYMVTYKFDNFADWFGGVYNNEKTK